MKITYIPWVAFFGGLLSLVFAYFSAVLLLEEYKIWAGILFGAGLLLGIASVYCSTRTVLHLYAYPYPVFALLGAGIGGFFGMAGLAIFIVGLFF